MVLEMAREYGFNGATDPFVQLSAALEQNRVVGDVLHFNVCYYAAIEHRRFESGAGDEYKWLRG